MHLRTRTWFIISLLCFLAAAIFWQLGQRKAARDQAARESAAALTNAPVAPVAPATNAVPGRNPVPGAAVARTNAANESFQYRLSNTPKGIDELSRTEHALLLRNALIDSSAPIDLAIPPHLRAQGDPGSYVVQSHEPLNDAYRGLLRQAGAEIISYVPNNAYLVRANEAAAKQLAALPQTQLVLPWEPYFKFEPDLLALAVEQKPLPPNARLNVLVFPGQREAILQSLAAIDAVVLSEERSPFGQLLVIRPAANSLVALAQLPIVQGIEIYHRRTLANDLSRARVHVSTNTVTPLDFLDLDGQGVRVNVNDTGVEAMHPDLAGRVSGDSAFTTTDYDGHGTHVAGTLASSGEHGPAGKDVPGSTTNANYRGMAPKAEIFALPIDLAFGPIVTDEYLQENAAATNAFISNNSWAYGGSAGYTMASASWDAAVRDASPGQEGSQPLLAVFAAGNSGAAGLDAPATAKNVIAVGAIKNMRYLTNEVIARNMTNQPWLDDTRTNNEVAAFSSVGNVGRGREGKSGRFKPDLVAPGTFVVSTRASKWVQPTNRISVIPDQIPFVLLRPGESKSFATFVPENGTGLEIKVVTNVFTATVGLPPLPIYVQAGSPPTPPTGFVNTNDAVVTPLSPVPGIWHFAVENPNREEVRFDIRYFVTVTNDLGNEPEVFYDLNQKLAPNYRYETGTSMAAPVVSGVLALMQQYFEQRLGITNSPALMKALLINGARSVNDGYDFNTASTQNAQGWGLVNLTNSLPTQESANGDGVVTSGTMVFYDQRPERALATGQSFTRTITVATNASSVPLRITLVWTDPPGNPAVGIKLVNDLDLVVTNLVTQDVYVGNEIGEGSLFNQIASLNAPLLFDNVNNVENVYLGASFNQRLSGSYSVTVKARRVNVNAVTAHPDGVVQDFALVICSGNPRNASALTVTDQPVTVDPAPEVIHVTNGIPILNQRVGANSPLLGSTNGVANQWRFYVVTNQLPPSDPLSGNVGAATNIAFATFLPPNLARPRFSEADIELFVSTDSNLTNLDQAVIEGSRRSVRRTGTESVVIENADPGALYYAGVKSEDQQSANFGFFAVSSSSPFSQKDTDGNIYPMGFPLNVEVPDGEPSEPRAGFVFAFCTYPITVQNVVVTNLLFHENGGDLFGTLDHDQKVSVLNANRAFDGALLRIYDDSDSGRIPESTTTDAPGTLRNFVGEEGLGLWTLTMVDSAPGFTGQVSRLLLKLEPRKDDLTNGVGIVETILPGRFFYTVVDVPADATNLSVCVAPDNGPVEVYIQRGAFPDRETYDIFGVVAPPGDCINLGRRDAPPLSQGRYFIGVFNPNASAVTVNIKVFIQRDLARGNSLNFSGAAGFQMLDDAVQTSVIHVNRSQLLSDVQVGVRIAHDRVSDLVLHLVSPKGTRILLAENRGGPSAADYGFGSLQTNVAPAGSSGGPLASTNVIGPVQPEGNIQVDYDFFQVPDRLTIYYDGAQIFDSGEVSGAGTFSVDYGPGSATNVIIVMNEGDNPNTATAWQYTATVYSGYTYAIFTENTNFAKVPIKFAPPPFTNFNYNATTFLTNAAVLDDSFESPPSRRVFAGEQFSGWEVVSADIEVIPALPGAPYFLLPDSGAFFIDISGFFPSDIFTNLTTVAGVDYVVSFAYARNVANPGPVSADVKIDGATKLSLVAGVGEATNWVHTNFTFRATGTSTRLELTSTTVGTPDDASAVFFDSFKAEQLSAKVTTGIYFLPEESLAPLRGENAFGDWTLEIWDNRVGGGLTNRLLAWKLNLTFVNTNPPATPLSNGVPVCLVLSSNETAFFRVDVPITASVATNLVLGSDRLDLLFNQTGEPIGTDPPDTIFLEDVLGGTNIFGVAGWNSYEQNVGFFDGSTVPTLQPGKRYYLAVHNRARDTNRVCVEVTFDELTPNLIGIIPLTNGCFSALSVPTNVNAIEYYSFDVSSNALGVQFEITGITDPDVDLVVRRGVPLPDDISYEAHSINNWPDDEFIEVDDFFGTRLPGRWYLGAIHRTTDTVAYTICARERDGVITPILTNQLYSATIASNGVQYYKVVISSNAYVADFLTTNATGDVDLYISTNTMTPLFQAPTNAMYVSSTPGSADELLRVSAFAPTNPLTPGCWFLAVVNKDIMPVNYQVLVTEYTTNLPYITLTNGVAYMDKVSPANPIGLFQFEVATNALQVVFETFAADGDVDLYLHFGAPLPPPGTNLFTYASTNAGTANEFICLLRGTTPTLRSGTWYLSVVAKDPAATVNYKVRATQIVSNDVVNLVNGASVCASVPPVDPARLYTGVQFYSIIVPRGPIQATFEIFGASGNVDLYVQRGLPLTNFTAYPVPGAPYPYPNEQPGNADEFLCLRPASAPVALSNGTWYVSVVNRDMVDVDYCVRASVIASPDVVTLADGVAECAIVGVTNGGPIAGVDYYVFNVASNAVQATFETFNASGNVDLYLTRDFCLTNFASFNAALAPYPYASTNLGTNGEFFCLRTNTQPVALTNGDWYLAVVNREPSNSVVYCVRATQLFTTNFTQVTNGLSQCRTIGVGNGTANAGIDYYIVTVTNSPALITFETFDASGDVDLYVSRDLCLTNFATFKAALTNYPYASTNLGTTPECLSVGTNSAPVALTNGDWYVAVVNRAPGPVDYCFLATTFDTDPSVPLTNDVTACSQTVPPTSSSGGIGVNYYVFHVATNALQVTFETFNANGNVDLYLQSGFCFQHRDTFSLDRANAPYASTNAGTDAEMICLQRDSLPVALKPGDWYLAVVNRESANVDFCIRARELLDTQVVGLTNRLAYRPGNPLVAGGLDFYHYLVSPSAVQVNFEILQPDGNVDLFVVRGFCPSNLLAFAYSSTNASNSDELIVVRTNSTPVALTPGEWFIAVTNADISPVSYTVRVTEVLSSEIIRLTNALPYTNTIAGLDSLTDSPIHYYVFNVSSNSVRAQFEILEPSGNVDLIARKGLPLPTPANSSLFSTNSGTGAELIVLFTNSTPVPLTPGDWYLSVLNPTSNAVTYAVVATEFSSLGTNLTIGRILVVSNSLCLTWSNALPGVNYYVEGKMDLNAQAWLPVSGTIRAVSTGITWCIPLPTPFHFFRIVEGLSPLSAGSPVTFTTMSWGSNGLQLRWNALPNLRFAVEWSASLSPPAWQPFPDYVTSATSTYTFLDDGSKTTGVTSNQFYRVFRVP